ncbi:hypothetical protein PV328_012153 [Microctonus aethiopoides]|uniref:Gag-pol polyprotein n=1 Tax=Microctonus aethiopoides TaxID=144406 RepID=A0AA39C2Q5_9HYME|nr:hypothetical protein PV328_012153 [Microctonus aethiopoides]
MSDKESQKSGRSTPVPTSKTTSPVPSRAITPTPSRPMTPNVLVVEPEDENSIISIDPIQQESGRLSPTQAISSQQKTDCVRTRASSPAGLFTELLMKVRSQVNRINTLHRISSQLPTDSAHTSLDEISLFKSQVDEIHKVFQMNHQFMETTWPASEISHEYFVTDKLQQELELTFDIRRRLAQLKTALTSSSFTMVTSESQFNSKLPDIKLPTFSGKYIEWPAYRDLFTTLILQNTRLSNVEKLHYLRSSTEGEALKFISGYRMDGSSLKPSWDALVGRYENKRLLIHWELDKLFKIQHSNVKTASQMTQLISTVSEVARSLATLGIDTKAWDALFVYQVLNHLDKPTNQAWEDYIEGSKDCVPFSKMEAFMASRICSLERIEARPPLASSSASQQHQQKATAHAATQAKQSTAKPAQSSSSQPADSKRFACDMCKDDHFLIVCDKFRKLGVQDRRNFIDSKALCHNCCGRHPTSMCRSQHRCKQCNALHRTMLHLDSAAPQQSTSQASTSNTR